MSPRPKGLLNKNVIQKELKSPKGGEMNLKVLRNPEMFCRTDFEKKKVLMFAWRGEADKLPE